MRSFSLQAQYIYPCIRRFCISLSAASPSRLLAAAQQGEVRGASTHRRAGLPQWDTNEVMADRGGTSSEEGEDSSADEMELTGAGEVVTGERKEGATAAAAAVSSGLEFSVAALRLEVADLRREVLRQRDEVKEVKKTNAMLLKELALLRSTSKHTSAEQNSADALPIDHGDTVSTGVAAPENSSQTAVAAANHAADAAADAAQASQPRDDSTDSGHPTTTAQTLVEILSDEQAIRSQHGRNDICRRLVAWGSSTAGTEGGIKSSKDMDTLFGALVTLGARVGAATVDGNCIGDMRRGERPAEPPQTMVGCMRLVKLLTGKPYGYALQKQFIRTASLSSGFYWRDGDSGEPEGPFSTEEEALQRAISVTAPRRAALVVCARMLLDAVNRESDDESFALGIMRCLGILHREGVASDDIITRVIKQLFSWKSAQAQAVVGELVSGALTVSFDTMQPRIRSLLADVDSQRHKYGDSRQAWENGLRTSPSAVDSPRGSPAPHRSGLVPPTSAGERLSPRASPSSPPPAATFLVRALLKSHNPERAMLASWRR